MCMETNIIGGFVPIFVFILIFSSIVLGIVLNIRRKKMLKKFALEHGYNYLSYGNIDSTPSLYLDVGHSREAKHVITGDLDSNLIKFFDFQSIIGHGKHKRRVSFSVCEIDTKSNLRRFLLLSKKMRFAPGNMYEGFKNGFGREIKLEGDFHKYFKLYVPEDYEIEVFQIFTPDIMATFIDNARDFTFEFVDNKMLIYKTGLVYSREKLEKLHTLAVLLNKSLVPKLTKI